MPIKVFRMHDKDYVEKDIINEWAEQNNFKIDNIDVCPNKWYLNKDLSRVTEMELIITVLYHKKRVRKGNPNGDV